MIALDVGGMALVRSHFPLHSHGGSKIQTQNVRAESGSRSSAHVLARQPFLMTSYVASSFFSNACGSPTTKEQSTKRSHSFLCSRCRNDVQPQQSSSSSQMECPDEQQRQLVWIGSSSQILVPNWCEYARRSIVRVGSTAPNSALCGRDDHDHPSPGIHDPSRMVGVASTLLLFLVPEWRRSQFRR